MHTIWRPHTPAINGRSASRTNSWIFRLPFRSDGLLWTILYQRFFKETAKIIRRFFVSFTTKALHLEPVENLTKDGCLDGPKKFTGRLGTPQAIYCNSSTTFIGARGELEFRRLLRDEEFKDLINNFVSQNHIDSFATSPRTPHFRGLCEAAVKFIMRHVYRRVGSTKLSNSAFRTLPTHIGAILNSHPLTAPSTNINDLTSFNPWTFRHRKIHHSYTRAIFTKEQHLVTTLEKHRQIDSSVLEEMKGRIVIFIAAAEQMEDGKVTTANGQYCYHQRRQHSPNLLAACSHNSDVRR